MAKRNDEEVEREVNRLLQEVAVYEQQAQQLGLAFASMSEEELASAIQQSGPVRPFGVYGSTVRAYPGATYTLIMGLINTGSVDLRCYVTLFFGAAATYMPDIAWALLSGSDPQWPIRTHQEPLGLAAGGGVDYVTMPYIIPDNVPLGRPYFGNVVVWNWQGEFVPGVGSVVLRTVTAPLTIVARP